MPKPTIEIYQPSLEQVDSLLAETSEPSLGYQLGISFTSPMVKILRHFNPWMQQDGRIGDGYIVQVWPRVYHDKERKPLQWISVTRREGEEYIHYRDVRLSIDLAELLKRYLAFNMPLVNPDLHSQEVTPEFLRTIVREILAERAQSNEEATAQDQ